MPARLRIAVLLLALAAMLGVSAAAATPAHLHLNSSASRCDLCFTAHIPLVQSPAVQPVCGPELQGPAPLVPVLYGYRTLTARPFASRGPPSSGR